MGSRSRVLLVFICLATAVASVVAPGRQLHRAELAGVAVLVALLLLRRHQGQPAPDGESAESGAEEESLPAPAPAPALAPLRRRFQTRAGHARAVALAALQQTLADRERQLAELSRTQRLAELAANERLSDLEQRLTDLETRADGEERALRESHHQHADQLRRLYQSITRHTEALHQLEHAVDPAPALPEGNRSTLDLTSTR